MRPWAPLLLCALPGAALAGEPAFSCAGALSVPEAAICAAPDLALADRVLSALYGKALAAEPGQRPRQRAFLAERDACVSDTTCLREAYGGRIAELGGLSGFDLGLTEFRWVAPLEGASVSGLWAPEASDDGHLRGPALFEVTLAETRLVLVAPEIALARDLPPKDRPLRLTWADRALSGACEKNGEDICLYPGEGPFDLQDLDFDGAPEALIADAGAGQRGVPLIWVYSLPEGRDLSRDHAVFGRIDGLTQVNLTRREIVIMTSSGACSSSADTYAAERNFALVEIEAWSTEGEDCHHDLTRIAPDGSRRTTRIED
ncbi:lysozyme inhibitor LprI family protein [Stagnihabitans tardus]|uniref:Lysozyme inhibitor LprI N-terminal domain-containing protein n=1 Tax=Stagnihabitans tardus TaxID=2699202 RepID=A0AAE5BTX9_9RHOB|nr:hypothetical protein [Stagnihabitans tardus]NBZ86194.1 hypothetical protein [Stagnihabitans tardus]